jgi:PAS domain S-box-containing protein
LTALVLTAAVVAAPFLVSGLDQKIAIGATLAVAVAVLAAVLAARFDRRQSEGWSEHRRTQEELADAEREYRDLTDSLPLVTWIYAIGDRKETRLVSPQIEALLGYTPGRMEWRGLRAQPSPGRPRTRPSRNRRGGQSETPFQTEYRMLARNGSVIWVREHARTISRRDGRPHFGESFLIDIGERKRAEAEGDRLTAGERAAVAETAERQGRLDLLREVAQLASSLDYGASIKRIAGLTVRGFADWCLVDLAEEGAPLKRVAVSRAEPGSGSGTPQQEPDDTVRSVVSSGKARIVPALGAASNGQEPDAFLTGLETRSVICAPIRARERSIGAITVARMTAGQPYDADDLALVNDLAGRLAISIDRARLYAEVEQRADAARVLAHVADGILLLDRNGIVRLWNPAAEGIMAIRAPEIIGRAAADAIHGWEESVDTIPIAATPDPGHA